MSRIHGVGNNLIAGAKRTPPVRTPRVPRIPSSAPKVAEQTGGMWEEARQFMGRSVATIRSNHVAMVAVFTGLNLGLLFIADKVNDLVKEKIAVFDQNKIYITEGIRVGIVFTGNFAFTRLIQYPLSLPGVIGITVFTIAVKHGFDFAKYQFHQHRDNIDKAVDGLKEKFFSLYSKIVSKKEVKEIKKDPEIMSTTESPRSTSPSKTRGQLAIEELEQLQTS